MISFIKGEIQFSGDDRIVIECNGIGYEIVMPAALISKIDTKDGLSCVYTYMSVRDDGIMLFGFSSIEEKSFYEKLISVSGVGPKAAINILGAMSVSDIIGAIVSSDDVLISRAPGIGKKTAQRIILELKDKISNEDIYSSLGFDNTNVSVSVHSDEKSEAIQALVALGYSRSDALKAVNKVSGENMDTQALLSAALREISRL